MKKPRKTHITLTLLDVDITMKGEMQAILTLLRMLTENQPLPEHIQQLEDLRLEVLHNTKSLQTVLKGVS